jgi:hypothetical protein
MEERRETIWEKRTPIDRENDFMKGMTVGILLGAVLSNIIIAIIIFIFN